MIGTRAGDGEGVEGVFANDAGTLDRCSERESARQGVAVDVRKVMYTTNAIEALNAQLTKVTRKRGAFPTPEAVRKVLYLAIDRASQRWTRPVQDWTGALNHLSIVFEGRVPV